MAGVARKTTYVVISQSKENGNNTWYPVETFELFTAARYYVEKLSPESREDYVFAIDKHEITTKVTRAWNEKG